MTTGPRRLRHVQPLKPILTGLRLVAVIEAAKGLLVLLAGLGLLSLVHRDVQAVAEHVVRFSHLNPASHYPRIFIEAASRMTNGRLWALAAAAAAYATARMVEAYGLWHERAWAEWFALIAGGMYLPVEVYELYHRWGWIKVGLLVTNVLVVAYMLYAVLHPEKQAAELAARNGPPPGAPVP